MNTNNIVMWVILPNNADWDCFKTLTSKEILKIPNSLLEEHCAVRFWKSHICSKKLDVQETNCCFSQFNRIWNHLSGHWTEIGWLPALELWDQIVSVLGNVSRVRSMGEPEYHVHKRQESHKKIDVIEDIDAVPLNVQSARQEALLYVFEDNEAVIKMIIKCRRPTMRHVSRTHRVALDWLFDRINVDDQNPNQIHRHRKPNLQTS